MAMEFALFGSMLLMAAACSDIVTRTIPDMLSLSLLVTGGLARLVESLPALGLSMAAALLLLILLMIAYSRGLIGGGDVKIMTALAVGLSPLDSYRFVIATAVAGGLLAVVYLVLSRTLRGESNTKRSSLLGRVYAVECWRIRRRGPLPYGVAIAAGGTFVLLHSGGL